MSQILFKDYLYEKFLEWEKLQKKRRSSISAFARWLSDNSLKIEIKHQVLDYWINGKIPKEDKYLLVLAEKLGNEIYEILERDPISPHLQKINMLWKYLPEALQIKISSEVEQYEAQNIYDRVSNVPKQRKVVKPK
jgi:hypothetical protein